MAGREELNEEQVDALCAALDVPLVIPEEARPVFDAIVRSPNRTLYLLTPDTEPDAIRAAQRGDVAEHLAAHPGATEQELSESLVLPLWSVRCRLAELRGAPVPWVRKEKPADAKPSLLKPKQ